jgi:hypothetical protein
MLKTAGALMCGILLIVGARLAIAQDADNGEKPPSARPVDERRVMGLVGQLGYDDLDARESAARELKRMGNRTVLNMLEKAASTAADPEVKSRLESVIRSIRPQPSDELRACIDGLFQPRNGMPERPVELGKDGVPYLLDKLDDETLWDDGSSRGTEIVCRDALHTLQDVTGQDFGKFEFSGALIAGGPTSDGITVREATDEDVAHNNELRRTWRKWWDENWDLPQSTWLNDARKRLLAGYAEKMSPKSLLDALNNHCKETTQFDRRLWRKDEKIILNNPRYAIPFLLDCLSNETLCTSSRKTGPYSFGVGGGKGVPIPRACINAVALLEEITGQDFGEFSFKDDGKGEPQTAGAENSKLREAWRKWWEDSSDRWLSDDSKGSMLSLRHLPVFKNEHWRFRDPYFNALSRLAGSEDKPAEVPCRDIVDVLESIFHGYCNYCYGYSTDTGLQDIDIIELTTSGDAKPMALIHDMMDKKSTGDRRLIVDRLPSLHPSWSIGALVEVVCDKGEQDGLRADAKKALEALTGLSFGKWEVEYTHSGYANRIIATPEEQDKIVQGWREWYEANKAGLSWDEQRKLFVVK